VMSGIPHVSNKIRDPGAKLGERLDHVMSTMSLLFATERQVAIAAVRRACGLTSTVFNKLIKNETLTKGDKSPVTGKSLPPDFHDPTNLRWFSRRFFSTGRREHHPKSGIS
jgi:hypothetical protein